MVLDRIDRIAHGARSKRADPIMLERFCTHFDFEPMAFDAADADGQPVCHANVMMLVGTEIARAALDMVEPAARRVEVKQRLEETGRAVVALSHAQIAEFAGNAIELSGRDAPVLALSERAAAALAPDRLAVIERHLRLLPHAVPTIELAGGSVRCMIASICLTRR